MPQPIDSITVSMLRSPINYTLTHSADHSQQFSHDMIKVPVNPPTLGMGKCPTAPGANRTRICHL